MPYRAPLAEYDLLMRHVVGLDHVAGTERFGEASAETVAAILAEAARMCEQVLAPLNAPGDREGARLENGVVRLPAGFAEGYRAVADGGWTAITASEAHGGLALPITVATAVNEMMASACLSLQIAPLMSQGQIEALEHHASDEIKALYLPKLVSGQWNGTMNLTEAQAGSDVGALRTKAEPRDDGTYAITGQKIYISWGDNDATENTVHLVLARLPDGVEGTKGISLFLVPKFLPDAEGNPGARNELSVVSLEHKLGLHGSPTAVMDYAGATGWLVGEPHKGMRAMFTMMNNARLGVGGQGIGIAERAYQHALAYAVERRQGVTPMGATAIVDHADVRRMLLTMQAEVFAARAIALSCAVAIDMQTATGEAGWVARAAFLTPIAKAFGSDTGLRVSDMGVQVHGGMGYIEETGAAQFTRDVRVTAIYEGTNGIQAMDLVSRKMMDEGAMAYVILDEIEAGANAARAALPDLAEPLLEACAALRAGTDWMVQHPLEDRFAGAVPYLAAFARVLGGQAHLKAAEVEGGARLALARFYMARMLPEYAAKLAEARAGSEGLYAVDVEAMAR